ncbi:MAG: acylphosphatase, partial [Candidatus Methylomirabilota bacterium]
MTIRVTGIVQGVGFRPFVYRLARDMGLKGFVRNTPRGVEIHIEGDGASECFVERLRGSAPPNARIDRIEVHPDTPGGYADFAIDTTSAG